MNDASGRPSGAGPAAAPRGHRAATGLGARRALGQHFLLDLNLTRRIARAAGDLADGHRHRDRPGPRRPHARAAAKGRARRSIAVERDERCRRRLAELRGRLSRPPDRDLRPTRSKSTPAALGAPPRRIVANLPYNVATPLLIALARHDSTPSTGLTLMFQKEVADRLTARPRTQGLRPPQRAHAMAARSRAACSTSPPRAFTPPPKVTSTVVQLTPRPAPLHPADRALLERVTAAAFGQRRKMLRQSLKRWRPIPLRCSRSVGIEETRRAEELDVGQFCALARRSRRR